MSWRFKGKVKIKCPLERLYHLISTPEGFEEWFVNQCEMIPKVGEKIKLGFNNVTMTATIVEIVSRESFSFTWDSDNPLLCSKAKLWIERIDEDHLYLHIEDGDLPEELEFVSELTSLTEGWTECLYLIKGVAQHKIDLRN